MTRTTRRAPSRGRGYALLEVITVVVVSTLLLGYFSFSTHVLVDQGSTHVARGLWVRVAHGVMHEIEGAIRGSVELTRVGTDVLVVKTQHFIDLDDEVERIGYRRSGDRIERSIAIEDEPFVDWEVMLSDVDSFSAQGLIIEDQFSAADYSAPIAPVGDPDPVDTTALAELTVIELGSLDGDLADAFRTVEEDLWIVAPVTPTTVTVSPPLEKIGLHARVAFQPLEAGVEYRPLLYGAESPDQDGVCVCFATDGAVRLRSAEAGLLTGDQVGAITWEPDRTYVIELQIAANGARARIRVDGTWTDLGTVPTGGVNLQRVRLQNVDSPTGGLWDDLAIEYPLVKLSLGTTLGANPIVLHGGATSRR